MNISNITPPQVWTASSRSLTNFGSGALTAANTVQTSLAANTNVDLRTSAGIVGHINVGVLTGAGATAAIAIQIFDGVNAQNIVATAAAAGVTAAYSSPNANTVGIRMANTDATHAGFYMTTQYLLTI